MCTLMTRMDYCFQNINDKTITRFISLAQKRFSWWRHQMTFTALLAVCAGNSLFPGEFPSQRPVTRSVDVYFVLRLNKWLGKQSRRRWFETPSRPLWHFCNVEMGSRLPHLYWCHSAETNPTTRELNISQSRCNYDQFTDSYGILI